MAIVKRILNLFKADVHYVLDHLEEPQLALEQAIRDMEEAVEIQELQSLETHQKSVQVAARLQDCQKNLQDLDQHVDECFKASNEDLARIAIKKRLASHKQFVQLSQLDQQLMQQKQETLTQLERQKDQLRSMKEKATFFRDVNREEHAEKASEFYSDVSSEEIELHFLREKSRRSNSVNS